MGGAHLYSSILETKCEDSRIACAQEIKANIVRKCLRKTRMHACMEILGFRLYPSVTKTEFARQVP